MLETDGCSVLCSKACVGHGRTSDSYQSICIPRTTADPKAHREVPTACSDSAVVSCCPRCCIPSVSRGLLCSLHLVWCSGCSDHSATDGRSHCGTATRLLPVRRQTHSLLHSAAGTSSSQPVHPKSNTKPWLTCLQTRGREPCQLCPLNSEGSR